jgi:predicted phage terminase large subunit-like protein
LEHPSGTPPDGVSRIKTAVREQANRFKATTILIEDKSSGSQLIRELRNEGVHAVTRYEPKLEKTMRLHSVTSTIENGFVYLPDKAEWLAEYVHEIVSFPRESMTICADRFC